MISRASGILRSMVDGFRSPLATDANAGSVAIVTGGGTGIGRATALELSRTGARVAICGRRSEPIEAVRAELEAAGREVLAQVCDVREPDQVAGFLDAVGQRFGHVDVLVNNAGGQFAAAAEDISLKGLRAVHRLNVDAVWHVTHEVATRWMIPRRGGSVFLLGFSPRRGIPMMAHSSMARAALETMAASLSNEWSHYGIRAVCIAAGLIDTEGLGCRGREGIRSPGADAPGGHARRGRRDDRFPRLGGRWLRHRFHGVGRRRRRRVGTGRGASRALATGVMRLPCASRAGSAR
jgi:citronellol/citronellal dehydrogenase